MPAGFVNDNQSRAVWADLLRFLCTRRSLTLLAMVAVMAGILGPFGTYSDFSLIERQIYWAFIVLVTVPVGHLALAITGRYLGFADWPAPVHIMAVSAIAAAPVSICVLLLGLGFGFSVNLGAGAELYVQSAAIIFFVCCLFAVAEAKDAQRGDPELLARLPGAKRGRLIRLAAQDHYVEVVTTCGTTLLAMRFRDAMAEAGAEPGVQIHRSHWVALRAVSGCKKGSGRARLALIDGSELPIGRTFRAGLKARGVL